MTKKKVAVLGGGLGAMTAVAWMTEDPAIRETLDITVYQMGWRLGGKGASGRGVGKRIEEHGLHIWFGFYENAFRTMRGALDQLGKSGSPVKTFASIDAAFTPQSLVTFTENWKGSWIDWPILFPPNGGVPGVGEPVVDLWDVLEIALGWLVTTYEEFFASHPILSGLPSHGPDLGALFARALAFFGASAPSPTSSAIHFARDVAGLAKRASGIVLDGLETVLSAILRLYLDALWLLLDSRLDDDDTRRFFILNDLAVTTLIGILEDDLFVRGFETVDGEDWAEWMRRHGARDVSVTSAPVRTVYDLVFGYEEGDTDRPSFAAGTAVRGLMRMLFTYKRALMMKMNAGMGDTIFTPFYGLLRERGVKFEFFHKVEALHLDAYGRAVDTIDVKVQATLVDPAKGYWPLERVKELDCWPAEPLWDQLAEADALRHDPNNQGHPYDLESWWTAWPGVGAKTLRRGVDFDDVILATSVATLPHIAPELIAKSDAWRRMVHGDASHAPVRTTPTHGVQLWLSKTSDQLGRSAPAWAIEEERDFGSELGLASILSGYAQPSDTVADLSHLLPVEEWPAGHEPASVQYITGPWKLPALPPFTDHDFPRRARDDLRALTIAFLEKNAAHLWPNGTSPSYPRGLDPMLLVDVDDRLGIDRYLSQWWRVNIDPNEQYVLSVRGSTSSRVAPGNTGFSNVFIAGDWTWNPVLNAGCVEGTVASGMECARAYCGFPKTIAGEQPRRD